ncbi:MAG: hypothetical protein AAB884_02510, partial [Patescibacteria group bacterium]
MRKFAMTRECSPGHSRQLPGSGFTESCGGEARYVAFIVYKNGRREEFGAFCVGCAEDFGRNLWLVFTKTYVK